MVSLGLSTNTDLPQDLANDLDGVAFRGDASTTLSTSTRSKTLDAGYYTGGTIKVPSDYFPVNSTNTTATASDVLSGKKFVNTSGDIVTGTIATATSSDISGSVSGSNPEKITLTTEKTSKSSTTTATARAIITKGLYTGSSNIEKDLTSQDFTATAEATLAASVTGTDKIPNPLPPGTVTITPSTDNAKRIFSDGKNKGFITNVVIDKMATGSYSASVALHEITKPTADSSVTGSITRVTSTTKPSGTDGTNYYTITPNLTTKAGSSKTKGKATIDTAGYLETDSILSPESSKDVEVTKSPGKNYYLEASSVSSASTTNPDTSSTSYANQATVTPTKSTQYVKITAGYLPNSKVTVNAIPRETFTIPASLWSAMSPADETGSYSCMIPSETTVNDDIVVLPSDTSVVASCGVYASGQGASSITFKAFNKPSSDIRYTVYILKD